MRWDKIAKATITGLRGLFGGLVIGIAVDRAVKFIDSHKIYDLASGQFGAAVKALDWVISQSWFWPSFWALVGFTVGTYLDGFVRRYRGPVDWFDPMDAIREFVDPELQLESGNLREQLERLSAEATDRKKRLDYAASQWPFGPNSPKYDSEIDALRDAWQATTKAAHETGEALWRKNQEILDVMVRQLKTGKLIAKAFRTNDHRVVQTDEPQIIPTSQWLLLTFDTYDQKRQTVTGPGLGYRGLQIGLSKSAN